jgi:predicted dienelactone hydrolase
MAAILAARGRYGGRMLGTRISVATVALVATATLAANACSGTDGGTAALIPRPTTSSVASVPRSDGPFAVGERLLTFVDPSRPTAPNRGAPGKPDRTLETRVFYPAAGAAGGEPVVDAPKRATGGPWPLVVFSHGFTANNNAYRNLIRWWAAAGYVVAAPTFPLSSRQAPGGPQLLDYRNQPADVSFVIDQLLRASADASGPLAATIDVSRVGVAGHSLGGLTTFGVAFNDCCIDARVKVAIPMSGLELPFDAGSSYFPSGDDTPVLIIHGDADGTVPVAQGLHAFEQAHAPKYLLLLHGEDHVIPFIGGRSTPAGSLVIDASLDFLDRYLKGRKDGIARLRAAVATEGRAELRADAPA